MIQLWDVFEITAEGQQTRVLAGLSHLTAYEAQRERNAHERAMGRDTIFTIAAAFTRA